MSKKYQIEEVKEIVKLRGYRLLSDKYNNAHEKLEIECPKHGVFKMNFCSFKNSKQNCPKCSHRSSKYTIEEVRNIISKKNCKLLSKEYINNSQKLEIECPKHGVFFKTLDNYNRSKNGCSKCSRQSSIDKKKNSYIYIKKYIEKQGFVLITKTTNYKNNKTKLEIECPKHGVFKMKFNDFQQGHKCPQCSFENNAKKQRNKISDIKKWIQENTVYKLKSNVYKNNKTKLEIECPKHGVFKMNWGHISRGHNCPKCKSVISSQHQEIIDYVKEIYSGPVLINDRQILDGKEIDIYIPEFNFGIEFDGLYWHSELCKKDCKKTNKEKANIIKEKKIKILMIYEDEWFNPIKKELIKKMIKHRMNIYDRKIRASKLQIKKMNKNNEFKYFFEKNHLDGHVQASFAYGLFDGDELISCMSFRKSFSDKCWEIARFATKENIKVYGNASKIIKLFKKEYNEKLVTYSNNRLSLGITYQKIGFKEITKTNDPSYYYTDFKSRLWRFKCKRINDPKILSKYPTEKAQAEGGVFSRKFLNHSRPIYRIYDYGHRKWVI